MIPINSNGNCDSDIIGSGERSCDITSWGDVLGINLHKKSFRLNVATDTITIASWQEELMQFNVIPYKGIYDFTQDTPDNDRATSSTGEMSTIRTAKPQFTFSWDRGACFHKSLFDKRGKGKWDFSLMFDTGILFATNEAGTEIRGFDGGLFDVDTLRLQQGTDPQMSRALIQLINAYQFNMNFVFITWKSLGVNLLTDVDGVYDTSITYTVVPTTATTFAVSVTGSCNSDDVILNLDEAASWRLGGTQTVPKTITTVVYRPATDDYLFTLSAALVSGDSVQPTLVSTDYDVAIIDDGLYKGKAPLATVA